MDISPTLALVKFSASLQIACGPSDLNVWALDNWGNIYARLAVTMDLPIGDSWRLVEGKCMKGFSLYRFYSVERYRLKTQVW